MKDCILAIFWPRQKIVDFFAANDCPSTELKHVKDFEKDELYRPTIVDTMFQRLAARPDGGLGPFRSMLQSLENWSHFDPYYFDKLKKLDRDTANRHITHLKQLRELRDAKIKEEKKRREQAEQQAQEATDTLQGIRDKFLDLHAGKSKPQRRGYDFQDILLELAKTSSLQVTKPFTVKGEQIDGAIKYDGEHYLVEAKWQDAAAANEAVYQFAGKVFGKMYGRGLFVSVHGYSNNVVTSLVTGKSINTVLIDGQDITLVLERHLSFDEMLDKKVKAAQTKGLIYVHPITEAPKSGF